MKNALHMFCIWDKILSVARECSPAGQSASFTSRRSRVRAPSFPPKKLPEYREFLFFCQSCLAPSDMLPIRRPDRKRNDFILLIRQLTVFSRNYFRIYFFYFFHITGRNNARRKRDKSNAEKRGEHGDRPSNL